MEEATKFFQISQNFNDMTDEQIAEFARDNSKEALDFLLDKYKELVYMKSSKYFIIGAEKDDIFQEGMIGLYKAIQDFRGDKQNSFKSFANMCIERQLITAIKTSNRQKHMPLNSYLSLNTSSYEDDDENEKVLLDVLNNKMAEDPLDTLTKKEYYSSVENAIDKSLSGFEKQVLRKFIKGDSYIKIAEELEAPVKSVDNAIQRIRKKALKSIVNNEEI
ncbi:MAG: RNA polymerase sporulation sigma factor SigH [Clostridia bacterium]|jgi:RNA polymerase sporulation-specific sigma factor|nr:RNA polymerase sporulation sigma factor SigH [Clostridia bacterium]